MKLPFSVGDRTINYCGDDDFGEEPMRRRLEAYMIDEPYTIDWIKSFVPKSVFWDIGANVGGFSFIAALTHPEMRVFSFEPNFINFYNQVKTCRENGIKNVFPFNVAVNHKSEVNFFHYDIVNNGSKGTFGSELKNQLAKSDYGNPFKRGINHKVSILGVSLDSLVYEYGIDKPNYIKIDVDGNELLVVKGAEKLLNESCIKQIFIEIDDKIYENNEIEKFMSSYSFFVEKDMQVGTDKKPLRMILYTRKN